MPLPSSINDLSQTAGSNSPSGSEAPSLIDDYLRTYASYIAQHRDGKGFALEASLASAATCDIGAANSLIVQITGTTGITSFGTTYSGPRIVRFAAALTLTHSASLVLPGAANITTAAGDFLIAVPNGNPASGYRVLAFTPAAGGVPGVVALANGGTGQTSASAAFSALKQDATESATGVVELATTAEAQAGTDTTRALTPARLKDAQIQRGTAVTLTSQTAVDFTGIPSWANRVTVLLSATSTSGTSQVAIRLGTSGGFATSGYNGHACNIEAATAGSFFSPDLLPLEASGAAAYVRYGRCDIRRVNGNEWVMSSHIGVSGAAAARNSFGGGGISLGGTLDRVRLTTVNGTDTFDGGSVNISWE